MKNTRVTNVIRPPADRQIQRMNNYRKSISRYYLSIYFCLVDPKSKNSDLSGYLVGWTWQAKEHTAPSEGVTLPFAYPPAYVSSDVMARATENIICNIILL